jgi:hypothetical protein
VLKQTEADRAQVVPEPETSKEELLALVKAHGSLKGLPSVVRQRIDFLVSD